MKPVSKEPRSPFQLLNAIALQEQRSPSEVSDSWFGQLVTTLGKTGYPKKSYIMSLANIWS
jgi:hypothetical protein